MDKNDCCPAADRFESVVKKLGLLGEGATVAAEPCEKIGHRVPVHVIQVPHVHTQNVPDDWNKGKNECCHDDGPPKVIAPGCTRICGNPHGTTQTVEDRSSKRVWALKAVKESRVKVSSRYADVCEGPEPTHVCIVLLSKTFSVDPRCEDAGEYQQQDGTPETGDRETHKRHKGYSEWYMDTQRQRR